MIKKNINIIDNKNILFKYKTIINLNFLTILLKNNNEKFWNLGEEEITNLKTTSFITNNWQYEIDYNDKFFLLYIFILFLIKFISIFELFNYFDDLRKSLIFYKLNFLLYIINIFSLDTKNYKKKIIYFSHSILLILLFEFLFIFFLHFYIKWTLIDILILSCLISIFYSIFIILILLPLYFNDDERNIKKLKRYEINKEINLLKIKFKNHITFKNQTLITLEIEKLRAYKIAELEKKYVAMTWWRKEILAGLPNSKIKMSYPDIFTIICRPGKLQIFLILINLYILYINYYPKNCFINFFNDYIFTLI